MFLGNLWNVSENLGKRMCGLENIRKRDGNLRKIVKNVVISMFIE